MVRSFNTQPPEGGCFIAYEGVKRELSFNTQPPEGGCLDYQQAAGDKKMVSTHSRPKAAAQKTHISAS